MLWHRHALGSLALQKPYLDAIANSATTPQAYYVTFHHQDELVGVASFSVTSFTRPSLGSLFERSAPRIHTLLKAVKLGQSGHSGHILTCGGPSNSGGRGFAFVKGTAPQMMAESLARAAQRVRKLLSSDYSISGILIQGLPHLDTLTHHGYTHFDAEPDMRLSIESRWESFSDYLASLTSKYRVKARRADAKSSGVTQVHLTSQALKDYDSELKSLYLQVSQRADFCLKYPEVDAIHQLSERSPEHVKVYGYFLGDHLIGFRMSLSYQGKLYAHLVGLDYALQRDHALYPRMLNDYVREAIESGCHEVHFGRTASEIKSTLGAQPHSTHFYLYHAQPLMNSVLPLISTRTALPKTRIHKPFKSVLT
jgi:hypothetical protein